MRKAYSFLKPGGEATAPPAGRRVAAPLPLILGLCRRIIYTTNPIEGFHRQVRKVTKPKGAFPSDMALMKLIYLTTQNIAKKWTMPADNWSLTLSQLSIIFGERLRLHLQVSPSGPAAFFKPPVPRSVNWTPIAPDTVPCTLL